jgi:hypothetical protein
MAQAVWITTGVTHVILPSCWLASGVFANRKSEEKAQSRVIWMEKGGLRAHHLKIGKNRLQGV